MSANASHRPRRAFGLAVSAVVSLASAASAQLELERGFSQSVVHRETASPYGASNFAIDGNGKVYIAIQGTVYRIDGNGRLTPMHALGANQSVGAMVSPPSGQRVLFTHFESSRLLTLDIASGRVTARPTLKNVFDLAIAPGGALVASANPSWPQPGAHNGIWRVDGASPRELIRLSGPSGPIAFDSTGNLYCGKFSSTSPPPPGSVEVLRFDAAAIRRTLGGGPRLTLQDATVAIRGLDAAHDFVVDGLGRLYISQPVRGGVLRTNRSVTALDPQPPIRRPNGFGLASTKMVFVDRSTASFDSHQPAGGGTLFVLATDWSSGSSLVSITPQAPILTLTPTPPWQRGAVRIAAQGLPRNAPCVLWLGTGSPAPLRILTRTATGIPIWSGTPGLPNSVFTIPGQADAVGTVSWSANYPGGPSATMSAEVLGFGIDRGMVVTPATAPARAITTR